MVNAVYHRAYDVREPVEVRVTQEEIAVINYPGPDRSVKLENLRRGKALPRRYRNRRIGEFLEELELTEGRSTGIPKIIRTMKNNGSPEAVFEFDEDHTYFLVRLPIHKQATKKNHLAGKLVDGASPPCKAPVEAPVEAPVDMPSTDHAILFALSSGQFGRRDLLKKLGLRQRSGSFKKAIKRLLEKEIIEMTIPNKPNSSLQKYRLTDKGTLTIRKTLSPPEK